MKKSIGPKTILYPAPVLIVGSYDKDKNPNIMAVAWGGICNSAPPCIAISVRESRLTYDNIILNQAFTINIPTEEQVKEADYSGIVSGREVNKFQKAGLTPIESEFVNAPYIKEFPLVIECKLIQTVNIGSHIQFIGEISDVKCDENCLNEKGIPNIEIIKPLLYAPIQSEYYGIGKKVGLAFKSGSEIKK